MAEYTRKHPDKGRLIDLVPKDAEIDRGNLHEILRELDEEDQHIYRLFGRLPSQAAAGGGFSAAPGKTSPTQKPADRHLGKIDFNIDMLTYPSQRVWYDLRGATGTGEQTELWPLATRIDAQVTGFAGVIDIESLDGASSVLRYRVDCRYATGNPNVPAGYMVGFRVGFGVAAPFAGQFFVQTQCYAQETTNTYPGQIKNNIPVSGLGATYYSGLENLQGPLPAAYDTQSGGAGLWFHCLLDIFGI